QVRMKITHDRLQHKHANQNKKHIDQSLLVARGDVVIYGKLDQIRLDRCQYRQGKSQENKQVKSPDIWSHKPENLFQYLKIDYITTYCLFFHLCLCPVY